MNLRNFVSKNKERLILFVSGVIVTAIASGLIEKTVSWSNAGLIGLTLVLVLTSLFLFSEITERVQGLSNTLETSVSYVEERYREPDGVKFQGRIYDALAKKIREANFEILILGATFRNKNQVHVTEVHPRRNEYLLAIEETIKRNQTKKFKYVRILQIPPEAGDLVIGKIVGDLPRRHCIWALEQANQNELPDLTIAIMAIETQLDFIHLK